MSFGNTFENELMLHIFQNADIPDIGDAAGLQNSAAAGSLYVALHTADPGETGTQSTNECAYTGYARIARARDASNWPVSANSVSPGSNIDFGEKTGGTDETATHWSVGVASSGATKILGSGTLSPNISIVNGTIPRVKTTSTITID